MVDPTSDLEEDVSEDEAPNCEHCGEPIVENPDHTVRPRIEDGQAHHRHFCSPECESAWEADEQ